MTRTDLAAMVAGTVLVVLGVALIYPPAAVILSGVALLAGVLLRDVPEPDEDKEQR